MPNDDRTPVVMVFTGQGPSRILKVGGSQSWKFDQKRARQCAYAVLFQNRRGGDWGEASAPHGEAFLIGRISDVVPSTDIEDRWHLQFSHYALLSNVAETWKGWKNPIRYTTLGELNILPDTLTFKPMPAPVWVGLLQQATKFPDVLSPPTAPPASPVVDSERGEVIAEAKQLVADAFGVPSSAVDISIRF
jgi:hypothetical protein